MTASGFGGFTGAFVDGTSVGASGGNVGGGVVSFGASVGSIRGDCVEGRATGMVGDDTTTGALVGFGSLFPHSHAHNDVIMRNRFEKNLIVSTPLFSTLRIVTALDQRRALLLSKAYNKADTRVLNSNSH